eukprot:c8209_g1_i2.p1 GENE.c8209_g1_i2~~c8209_g1_i2.p1  ORF type:complete len:527 (+),score=-6.45 c8209_g1_i2:3-1583(+)
MTLQETLVNSSKKYGSLRCGVFPEEDCGIVTLSYTQLFDAVMDLKAKLVGPDVQLKEGDAVSIVLPNGLEFAVTFLATTFSRCVAAPLNTAYSTDECEFYIKDTSSKIVIVPKSNPNHPARAVAIKLGIPIWETYINTINGIRIELFRNGALARPAQLSFLSQIIPKEADVALFLHTSGTTSQPKGVPLTHLNLTTSLQNIANTYELSPSDTSLIVMPLFHVHGLMGQLLSILFSGGSMVIPVKFSASKFWAYVEAYSCTWYSAVPTIQQTLLVTADANKAPFGKLRFIRSCSSSLAPVTLEKLEKRFGAAVLEAYGMTEASHQMSSNPLPKHGVRKPGTVGKPTNVDICIMNAEGVILPAGERGEICIRGKNVTLGYHNNKKANEENFRSGWFRTGDEGFLDSDNYLTLTGRLKEIINRAGEKISPIELDSVLLKCNGVAEAVSFAFPDEKYGEVVHVAVIPKADANLTEEYVLSYCKANLASFKVPARVHISATLPRTDTGKIQRRKVSEHFQNLLKHNKQAKL